VYYFLKFDKLQQGLSGEQPDNCWLILILDTYRGVSIIKALINDTGVFSNKSLNS